MKLNSKKLKVRELWPDDPAYHGLIESIPGSNSIGRPLLYCSDCDRMVNFYSQIISEDEINEENSMAVFEKRESKYKDWEDHGYEWWVQSSMTFVRGALKHCCDDCKKMNLFSDKEKYKSGIPLDYDHLATSRHHESTIT